MLRDPIERLPTRTVHQTLPQTSKVCIEGSLLLSLWSLDFRQDELEVKEQFSWSNEEFPSYSLPG